MPMTDHFPAAGDDIGRSAELQPAQLTFVVSAARVKAPRSHRGSAGQGACRSGAGANHVLHVLLTAFSLLSFASGLRAEIRLAALFRDGAVLQRDKLVPIWGSAIAREEIRVQFGAQMAAALVLPNTGMAVAVDVGEATNLHPPNKQEVGRRLALHARVKVYGEKIACESPRALGFEKAGHGLRVRLSEAAGLHLRDGKSGGAEIAGADRVFHPATIRVEDDGVVFASTAVSAPVAIRYAWKNAPETCLYNGAGLPVAPFRSDDW